MENEQILGSVTIPVGIIDEVNTSGDNIADFKALIEKNASENTTNLLDVVLFGAIRLKASDIHLEPEEGQAKLRIRIDGALQDVVLFNNQAYESLLSRLKLLSRVKLNIVDQPQDGRFTITTDTSSIEIRTSTLPAEHGESVVMRILNPKNLIGVDALGLRKDVRETLEQEIKKPNGMIIVAGPTGSGKTTTLYAFLKKIQNSELKTITIEDPIEYHIEGISQTQVAPDKGYDFSEGLRSIVRQDPDVILVGEIRDSETAKIAVQAALTGHLVLSTLHANDASGTIPRLMDLGVDATSIAPALNIVVGERLVRKVCPTCSTKKKATEKELQEIEEGLKGLPSSVEMPKDLGAIEIAAISEQGCKECNFTGYKGRKGIFEMLLMDKDMEKFILKNPPVSEIKEMAIKKGMVTIWQSGLIEVVLGETTLEEVKKVAEADK